MSQKQRKPGGRAQNAELMSAYARMLPRAAPGGVQLSREPIGALLATLRMSFDASGYPSLDVVKFDAECR